jgi:hypothetical protein
MTEAYVSSWAWLKRTVSSFRLKSTAMRPVSSSVGRSLKTLGPETENAGLHEPLIAVTPAMECQRQQSAILYRTAAGARPLIAECTRRQSL